MMLNGKDHYLGVHGSAGSRCGNTIDFIAAWLGRRPPDPGLRRPSDLTLAGSWCRT